MGNSGRVTAELLCFHNSVWNTCDGISVLASYHWADDPWKDCLLMFAEETEADSRTFLVNMLVVA